MAWMNSAQQYSSLVQDGAETSSKTSRLLVPDDGTPHPADLFCVAAHVTAGTCSAGQNPDTSLHDLPSRRACRNGEFPLRSRSSDGVAAVDTKVSPSDIARRIREEKRHRAHEVLWVAHVALGNQRCPLLLEIRVVVEDLLRPMGPRLATNLSQEGRDGADGQSGERSGP